MLDPANKPSRAILTVFQAAAKQMSADKLLDVRTGFLATAEQPVTVQAIDRELRVTRPRVASSNASSTGREGRARSAYWVPPNSTLAAKFLNLLCSLCPNGRHQMVFTVRLINQAVVNACGA